MADIKELSGSLNNLQKQIRFASAQALTKVARKIEQAEREQIQSVFDTPTPFTVKSVGSRGANRDNLTAKVFVRDIAASYLEPYEFGGVHKLNGNTLLNPKNIKLNKYGNLPRNKLTQLKAKPDVFIGSIGGVDGVWQRKKARARKGGNKRRKRSKNGTRQPRIKQPMPKLLIRFGDALPVNKHLGYFDTANKIAESSFNEVFESALSNALATAR